MRRKEIADYPTVRVPETGCLRWMGPKNSNGYGRIGPYRYVHREAYEIAFGPIPEGHEVDHVWDRGCRFRDCIEPTHLEAVTGATNKRRNLRIVEQVARDECPKGHPYDEANTYVKDGSRNCRRCGNERDNARYARRRDPRNARDAIA